MKLEIPEEDFEGFIFDLDGTLIDSMPIHYLAWNEVMKAAGIPGELDEDLFYSLGGVPTVLVAERIGEHYGLKVDGQEILPVKEEAYLRRLGEVEVIEEVAEFARRAVAEGVPVSIATGGTRDVALPAVKAAKLDGIFKIVVTPEDVPEGRGKPAPDMFLVAARRMGVVPGKCLVFEDAEPGMRGARAAGMRVVEVPSRERRK